jgi:alanine dehydrogenase
LTVVTKRVGLAAEHASPEDPAGSETRVALTPAAVGQLSDHGHSVAVEAGAGARMGFSDDAYRAAGAAIVARDELYRDRDVVIKIKGPAHAQLRSMDPGSLLICMAHVKSIPQRAAICDERSINLLALELVTERPPAGEARVRSKLAMEQILADDGRPARELHIAFAGFAADAFGALQHAARSHPRSLAMIAAPAASAAAADAAARAAAAEAAVDAGARAGGATDPRARGRGALVVDLDALAQAAARIPASVVEPELARLPARRKIESLHETGRAGARFGLDLAVAVNDRLRTARDAYVTVLGYGNVAFGALDECVRSGVPRTHVRTERTTERELLRPDLEASDLIVNGIDGREDPRSYVIADGDLGSVIRPGTVVVDLVGGSATNRGAVEPIVECTTPDDPFIVVNGVYLSSVWGWPLVGFARESMERYSEQILRMLLYEERILDGIEDAPAGIRDALVAGPLSARAPG